MWLLLFTVALSAEPASAPADDDIAKAMREAAAAFGDSPASQPSEVKPVTSGTEVNGYVSNRLSGSWNDTSSLIPVSDQPEVQNLLELNVQLRRPLWPGAFAYFDASAFLQTDGVYVTAGPNGARTDVANHDVASLHPQFVLSEGYVSWSPAANLNVLVGKKRIVWGSGLVFNPTDVLNPAKDPTDPNLQRAGAFVARVEAPFDNVTFSLLASPEVLYQDQGLPYQFLVYPDYPPAAGPDPRDKSAHYLLAARWYMLIANSDINLIYYYSNKYGDLFSNHSRLGGSFSRYFFTDYEFHVEGLIEEGSRRQYVNGACVGSAVAAAGCVAAGSPLYGNFNTNDGRIYGRLIAGTRRVFSDESQLSIEYLFVGDGLTPAQFQQYAHGLTLASQAGINLASASTGSSNGGLINRFTLDPLRRHYLFASYSKPKIADDWTVGAVLLADLEDLSGLIAPSVTWNTFEWLNLMITGFIPIRGVGLGADVNGKKIAEYGLIPFDWRVLFEARFFY